RHQEEKARWNSYLKNSFYLVFTNIAFGYLAGDADKGDFLHTSGQPVSVLLPATSRVPTYALSGPGISAAEAVIPRRESQNELLLTQAATPGNFALTEGNDGKAVARFSLNPAPEESQLARVPAEQIAALLGDDALLPVGHGMSLQEALQGHRSQPVELFPW